MSDQPIRIATRGSRLALWQANHVAELLRRAAPQREIEIEEVSTTGDRDRQQALSQMGGIGVFTREIQLAVLDRRADIAVHSLKDLPTAATEGLTLAGIPQRASMYDALVLPAGSHESTGLASLPQGARVGTGSLRRRAQLLYHRRDLQVEGVRGNVETRIEKLDSGRYEALVLAEAGLKRLALGNRISATLRPPQFYSAVGQGALGIECRSEDDELRELLAAISDPATLAAVSTERALLAALRAGCHAPVGVETRVDANRLTLEAVVLSPDGRRRLTAEANMSASDARRLGTAVADDLDRQGAQALMRQGSGDHPG